ncbi:hypothetical protein POVCU2_0015360 [Plasmodium ovale curtisi]|uniref:Uncharacterized protein n=1 Tax=Plasmodium ovale curtisi TaxID=864141 RepID=A0A1A8VPH3_PLAOA|nr:hypothetical protein POVCU2_0015360 [Plasmodium ovale curtisi]SBS87124.1 hypothetical protein POVCU1_014110 [Plasmodium ovale curtisi]
MSLGGVNNARVTVRSCSSAHDSSIQLFVGKMIFRGERRSIEEGEVRGYETKWEQRQTGTNLRNRLSTTLLTIQPRIDDNGDNPVYMHVHVLKAKVPKRFR